MTTYIQHICKNPECQRIFLDVDLTRASSPVKWKYCEECVNKGYKNPTKRPMTNKIRTLLANHNSKKRFSSAR